MIRSKLFPVLVLTFLGISLCSCAPYRDEDDEYDDDPELPERNAILQKLQEELERQQQEHSAVTSTTSTTTTRRPQRIHPLKRKKQWVIAKDVRGYQILSDGPKVHAELIKTRPMLRIRIDIPDTVRHVEKIIEKRHIELKIRNWDKVHKVHVKVPFGYEPEDVRIAEMKDHIDIVAPIYADVDETDL